MQYRVYVRFEDSPSLARKNAQQQPDDKYGALALEAVNSADPGEEEPILHEALTDARINGKFVALYRGQPAGHSRRGGELFVPIGLAWCKDSGELAQMLGISAQSSPSTTNFDTSLNSSDREPVYQREKFRDESTKASPGFYSDSSIGTGSSDESTRGFPARSDAYGNGMKESVDSRRRRGAAGDYSRASTEYDDNDDYHESENGQGRRGYRHPSRSPRERFADESKSWGWLAWTGIFIGCFVGAFLVVYGLATFFGS